MAFYFVTSMIIGFLFRSKARGLETLYFLLGVFSFYLPGTIISYMTYDQSPYKFIGFMASVATSGLVYYLLTKDWEKDKQKSKGLKDNDILDDIKEWE